MSTPTMHELTPPQEGEGLNPLQLEEMTPQQVEEGFRQLNEENRQLREVLGRGVFTPRMDKQPSRPMEEMAIKTTPEAMPKTLNNLCSIQLFVRVVSILTFGLVAVLLPEAQVFRKISTGWSYFLELFCGYLTVNRLLGVVASHRRKDPLKEFLWSIFNLVMTVPVHYVAYEYLSRQENPTVLKCLVLSMFTIASGISPDTAEFVNYRTFCALWGLIFWWIAGKSAKGAEIFSRWASD